MNGIRRLTPKIILAATLALLPACSPRQPIPSAPADARPEAEVRAERQHKQAAKRPQATASQQQGPVEETVVAEVRDPQSTDAQIKTAVAKTEAQRGDPLDEALAEEDAKARSKQNAPKPAAQQSAAQPADQQRDAAAKQDAPATADGDHAATTVDATKDAAASAEAADKGLMVQIASFGEEKNADAAMAWLKDMGYAKSRKMRVDQGGKPYLRVQAGPFQDQAAARKALEQLKADWPQAFIPAD